MSSEARAGRPLPAPVLGMALFISSEVMFFGGLFGAYFTLRARADAWPPSGTPELELWLPSILTAVLLTSSFAVHRAERALARGEPAARWLGLTIALGLAFLAGQAFEYSQLDLGIDTNAFGTLFFTITGAHGLHVALGVAALAIALAKLRRGHLSAERGGALEAAAYYWHFVDVVWLLVFSTLYLLD